MNLEQHVTRPHSARYLSTIRPSGKMNTAAIWGEVRLVKSATAHVSAPYEGMKW
jgi:hypothetical protein